MKPEILVFTDKQPGTTMVGMLNLSLKRVFKGAAYHIRQVTIDDINNGILTERPPYKRAFILPGIKGEDSPYQHNFTARHVEELHSFVGAGNVFVGFCAGAFFVSEITQFVPPWPNSAKHLRSTKALFPGIANGPIHPYTIRDSLTVVPVRYKNELGEYEDAYVPYSMGPGLHPNNPNDPDLEIIGTYPDIAGQPAALLRQQIGLGGAYLCSPHPEMFYMEFTTPSTRWEAIQQILNALRPHEESRQKFWDHFTNRIKKDLQPCP